MTSHSQVCPICGYTKDAESCGQCHGQALSLGRRKALKVGRGQPIADVLEGFIAPFAAFPLLMSRPEFKGKLKWAILTNVLVLVPLLIGCLYGGFTWIFHLMAGDWGWFEWMHGALGGAVAGLAALLLTLLILWFLTPVLIETVTAPFLDPLAQAAERSMGGPDMRTVEIGIMKSMVLGLRSAGWILLLQILILIPTMLLSFIPVVGWPFVILGVLVSAYLNALLWFEIPVLRRGFNMTYRRAILRKNWARALGFGLGFYVGLLVPIFNILFLAPATAVAVSRLYFRFDKEQPS